MRSFRTTTTLVTAAALATGSLLLTGHPSSGARTELTADQATAAASIPARYAAPYLQINSSDAGDMAADMSATGLKYYTLAFLIPQSGCTPEWEDNGDPVGAFGSQIKSLQAAGAT